MAAIQEGLKTAELLELILLALLQRDLLLAKRISRDFKESNRDVCPHPRKTVLPSSPRNGNQHRRGRASEPAVQRSAVHEARPG